MKQLFAIVLIASISPDVLQNLKTNVEKENLEEKIEEQEDRDEYIESHRFDEPVQDRDTTSLRGEKEKDHGRDDSE